MNSFVSSCSSLLFAALGAVACGGGTGGPPPVIGQAANVPLPSSSAPPPGRSEVGGIYGASIEGFSSPSMLFFAKSDTSLALLGVASATGFEVQTYMITTRGSWMPAAEPGWWYNSFAYPTGPEFGNSVQGYWVTATHHPETPSLSGTMVRSSGSWRFSGGPVEYSSYNFNEPMPASEAAGHWELRDLADNPVVVDIDEQGSVQGSYQGCTLAGSVAPPASNKGYLSLSVTLDGATCPNRYPTAPVPYKGFAVVFPLSSGLRQSVLYGFAEWGGMDADALLATGVR